VFFSGAQCAAEDQRVQPSLADPTFDLNFVMEPQEQKKQPKEHEHDQIKFDRRGRGEKKISFTV
jgi:hypothetical protein